ncbi:hypothetical protein JQM96_15260 [Bacteroides uniformis]|uniref:Major fimbrial subunit protein N-terminal domain-containing protein n=1 Tax=Bacteroides uniformis TaxID=820 RepID=A0ABS5X748_BACUN|nr:hypothetical protein [Bacteroides uniformis]MBT8727789.1 hypothetical protein [Bacteroides uniformis]
MKRLIYLLLAMPLFFTSCSKDEEMVSEESVQVSFSTELPKRIGTRASTTDLNVNKVVCAVFEDGEEIGTLREVITIQEGEDIVFAPRLIKGRTYDVVFWAMKDKNYNVNDMTAITRASETTAAESDFDAFTESVEVEVTGSKSETVTLKRPLAQLNLGVTLDDWNAVASEETFGMKPTKMIITLTGKDTFNALTGATTGEDKEVTYTLDVSGEDLVAGDETYKSIAMCYVYPDAGQENIDITYTIYDQDNDVIREDVTIQNIPLENNYRTNVVGGLLTGTITYTITFEKDFNTTENNATIE